jgi:hypothetical protein
MACKDAVIEAGGLMVVKERVENSHANEWTFLPDEVL